MSRLRAWALPALPLICALFVMIVGGIVRDVLAKGSAGTCCTAANLVFPTIVAKPGELSPDQYAGRASYIAAAQVQVAAIGVALLIGIALAISLARGERGRLLFVLLVLGVGIATALLFIYGGQSPGLHRLLATTVASEFHSVETVRILFERLTAVAATLLVAVASLLLLPADGDGASRLQRYAEHYRRLSYLLTIGTILLAADVLVRTVLGRWGATYFAPHIMDSFVESIVAGWGVYNSMFLAAIYVPSAVVLRLRLREDAASVNPATAPPWFDRAWLTDSPLKDLARAIAILTPFLVGQASGLLKLL